MIYELLGFAAFVVLFMNFEPYHRILKFLYLDMKPFNCTLCMGFWLTIGTTLAQYGLKGILYSALIAIVAEFTDRKLNNF